MSRPKQGTAKLLIYLFWGKQFPAGPDFIQHRLIAQTTEIGSMMKGKVQKHGVKSNKSDKWFSG